MEEGEEMVRPAAEEEEWGQEEEEEGTALFI